MILHVDDDVEVAGRAAAGSGLALAVEAEALAARDAGRDANGELALPGHVAVAAALRARLGDDAPLAAALAAGLRDGEEALLVADLPAPAALRAHGGGGPGRGARALARLARLLPRDLDAGLHPLGRFVERDLEVVAQIGAALRPAAPSAAAEEIAEAEDVAQAAEDVAEVGEDRRVEPARAAAPS